MIPNQQWFPTSLLERAAWYANFNTQVQATGTTLGLAIADRTAIATDNDMMQFLATSSVTLSNYSEAMTQFRNIITAGDIGNIAPTFPANLALTPPAMPPVGIFERVANVYRPRIMASAAYTPEQGALYGLIGGPSTPPDPATVQPDLKTFPAKVANMFSVVVSNRGQADQTEIWGAEAGTTAWKVLGTITGKAGDITVPNTTGKPIQLQVRAQLRKSNANYGQPSNNVMTTINP